jgi:hypothetical protein
MFVFVVGCRSFDVVVKDDPFKGSTVVSADMWHTVTDSRLDNQRMLYEKEIKNGKVSIPTVSFQFFGIVNAFLGYNGEDIGKEVYILCDKNSYKVKINDYRKLVQENVRGQGSTNASGQYSASVKTIHTSTMTGKISLMPDVQNAILNCNEYMMRFYVGDNPLTLKATSAQLKALKKFIATNTPDAEKKK